MTYYNQHESQYGADRSLRTRQSGCTWTSLANGVDYATRGVKDPEPDSILSLVRIVEETNPATPGWSLADAKLAMDRLGVPFENRSGQGWLGVLQARSDGLGIVLQGDSDRFGNNTCSGAFDGDHAIFVHPVLLADGRWRIDDPICSTFRTETESVLRSYAEKFDASISFGVFTEKPDMVKVTKYGPWTVDIAVGKQLYDLAGNPLIKVARAQNDIQAPNETVIGTTTYVQVALTTGGSYQYVLVKASDISDRRAVTGPKPYTVDLKLTVGGKPVTVTTGPLTLP